MKVFIDTDTASDDAVALLMAARDPDLELVGVSVVGGNVDVDQGVKNALYTLEFAGAPEVPVYRGLAEPLVRPLQSATHVHGEDGMGDQHFPPAAQEAASGHGVDALIEAARAHAGDLTLITLGPLTNVAAALRRDAGIATAFAEVYVMGGTADAVGNVTACAEYNIWVDPEAARCVFASEMPVVMVGWDLSRAAAVMTPDRVATLRQLGTPEAQFVIDINTVLAEFCASVTGLEGFDLPDPLTVAVASDPSLMLDVRPRYVGVATDDGLTRGMTVIDHLDVSGRAPTARVCFDVNSAGFFAQLQERLG